MDNNDELNDHLDRLFVCFDDAFEDDYIDDIGDLEAYEHEEE